MKKILFIIVLVIIVFFGIKSWQSSRNSDSISSKDSKDIVGADLPPVMTVSDAEKLVTLPFYERSEKDFKIGKTYYVAINQPSASNDNNGLYSTYQGGVNGPFKDLNDDRIRNLLQDKSEGVKLILRQGVYKLIPTPSTESGLVLRGKGDEFHPVIITSYPGETAVIDGEEKLPIGQLKRIAAGQESYNIKIRQVIQLEGQYNIVENLTIRDGWRHNVAVLGKYSIIRNNKLIGAYEDSVKNTDNSDYGILLNNDISGFGSQALDHFGADNWLIKSNNIHDPGIDPPTGKIAANGIGAKGGNNNVVIINNTIHDFDTDINTAAIGLGGVGAIKLYARDSKGQVLPSVTHGIAIGNTIYNYRGPALGAASCSNCAFVNNIIYNTVGAFRIGISPDIRQGDENARALPTTSGTVIKNNKFSGNDAKCADGNSVKLGMTCYVFFIETNDDAKGLISENNTYYSDTSPLFVYRYNDQIQRLDHKQFIELSETDQTSSILPLNKFLGN